MLAQAAPAQPSQDAFEQAQELERRRKGLPSPAVQAPPEPAPEEVAPAVPETTPLDTAKLKQSMNLPLTPEEQAALDAEAAAAQAPPAEAGGVQGMLAKIMGMIGLGE
jgi:hypothetical protein